MVPFPSTWGNCQLRSVRSPDDLPETFNLAAALVDRHLAEGRGSQLALHGPAGNLTYDQLYHLVNQTGNALRSLGLCQGERVLLLLRDSPEFFATFLGAIKIGATPVALNTFAHPSEYEFYLRHSKAQFLVGEAEFLANLEALLRRHSLRGVISVRGNPFSGVHDFRSLVSSQLAELAPAPTRKDDPSHWVYTSGCTGEPKAAVHLHKNPPFSLEPYASEVLRMTPRDVNFCVSRLFFSYGLASSLLLPLWVGAGVVLMPMRPEVSRIFDLIEEYRPTLFFCVPTGYHRLLQTRLDVSKLASLRLCVSSGEALPEAIYRKWTAATGLELIDGVSSTEFGYIFLSQRPGAVRPGVSGWVLSAHSHRLVSPNGTDAADGEMGELWLSSPAIAAGYWADPDRTREAFVDGWLHTGDQYIRNRDGSLTYQGRSDDLIRNGDLWVSPVEIENVLLAHSAVAEVSVVAQRGDHGLDRLVAHVVLKGNSVPSPQMADSLRQFLRSRLATYKCPRIFNFVPELPKTATGKIQRFKLRRASSVT